VIPGLAKKMFSTTVDIFLPAILFASCVFYYCDIATSFEVRQAQFFHNIFLGLCSLWALYLFFAKQSKDTILMLFTICLYIGLNALKQKHLHSFDKTLEYQLLSIFVLINWFLYLATSFFKLAKKYDFYLLLILLSEATLIENARFLPIETFDSGLKLAVLLCWLCAILGYIIYVSIFPNIKNYGLFFAFLCIWLGFFNSETSLGLSLYFSFAVLILLITTIHQDIYCYFKDSCTGVYSLNSYLRKSKNLPLKYSLGVVCIDDYVKLLKVFKEHYVNIIVKLVVKQIRKIAPNADIYRYNEDEFILIFKNVDKKQCFEYLEEIRRLIAGSEFVLSSKRTVKITVSAGVSEKKRSDADADTVLMRTREADQRTYKFTQNMTSKA